MSSTNVAIFISVKVSCSIIFSNFLLLIITFTRVHPFPLALIRASLTAEASCAMPCSCRSLIRQKNFQAFLLTTVARTPNWALCNRSNWEHRLSNITVQNSQPIYLNAKSKGKKLFVMVNKKHLNYLLYIPKNQESLISELNTHYHDKPALNHFRISS